MKKIELLAPAGSLESLYAAVQNGADAVYMGGTKFSARAYASNFDEETMKKALEYCHLYNVKVYITLNTLIKEEEINEALEYISFLYKIGIDALIIQDVGIAELIRSNFPNFEIHASTQMTVHNGEGALLLKELGFSRIVLSRELSLKEVEHISKDLNIETEIFVHGALCICYSGQCLMSSMIGGRSGNRGKCAQPCRLPYDIISKNKGVSKKGYLLSPKDMCTIENVKEIILTGTASLKIEGRMKKPEYVAGVVASYRKAIDKVYDEFKEIRDYEETNNRLEHFDFVEEEKKLMQLFNREGFSKAYMFGNIGRDMMSYNHPRNTGVRLGKVNKDSTITLEQDLNLQDGVRTGEDGFTVTKIIINKQNVEKASKGEVVEIKPNKYKQGDVLYKTLDVRLMEELRKTYENLYKRKNYIDLSIKFKIGEPISLTAQYGNKKYTVVGEKIQDAIKKPLDKESLVKNLNKTGDTPFAFRNIDFDIFEEGFLPVSSINLVRRELLQKISDDITAIERISSDKSINLASSSSKYEFIELDNPMIILNTREQLKAAQECEINSIVIDLFMKKCDINIESLGVDNLYIRIPTIVKGEFSSLCKIVEGLLPRIKGIVTSNLGIIRRFKEKTLIIGDYKLNIFNSHSLKFYKDILDSATISLELNKKEITNLVKKSSIPSYLMIYGKPELMISEYCPIGSVFGEKSKDNQSCSYKCHEEEFVLKDRKGEEFPTLTDKYCRSHIYNASPINLIPNLSEIKNINITAFRLDFINESYEETIKILQSFIRGSFEDDFKNYTRGHFKRGVE